MKKLFQISIVSLILTSNYVGGQQKLSLNDAVKITLENNLDIKIVENQDEIFKNNASFLNSGYLPTISSNAGINKSEQNIEIETPNNLSGKLDNMKSENSYSNISLNYILLDNSGRNFNYKKCTLFYMFFIRCYDNSIFNHPCSIS